MHGVRKVYFCNIFNRRGKCSFHIETSQLICIANQSIGFYMWGTLFVNELNNWKILVCLRGMFSQLETKEVPRTLKIISSGTGRLGYRIISRHKGGVGKFSTKMMK